MPISKEKTAIVLYIDKSLKTDIESLAKKELRSTNNLINKILQDYINESKSEHN